MNDVRKDSLTWKYPGGLHPDTRLSASGDLARLLGGSPDSFTGRLLELAAHADPGNKHRLRTAFPRELRAWEIWMQTEPAPTAGAMAELLRVLGYDVG